MSTLFSIGAMNQLGDALEKAGFTAEDVTSLKQFKDLGKLRDVLFGKAFITYSEHMINCDAVPFVPNGWSVVEHKKTGFFKFDPAKISFYLSKKQKKGSITGNDLRKELAGKPVMNANVLDYLLAHSELIPEEWKEKRIFFWGTIYRSSDSGLCVRYLSWDDSRWSWRFNWLVLVFRSDGPAALAS